ncbi:MAG: AMP-binding protein, partial [Deltaproteobacteria bacterium]|nr:AMP-binding protein [Deltaproteobacteria bacterium]
MTLSWPVDLFADWDASAEVAFGGAETRTFGELIGLAGRISEQLETGNPGSATIVACLDRFFFTAAVVGSWMAKRPITLPPNTQPATIDGARDAEPGSVVLHDTAQSGGVNLRLLEFASGDPGQGLLIRPEARLARLQTSGTTATPVSHWKTADQLIGEAHMLAEHFELRGRRVLACVPAHHLYGLLFGVLVPILGRGSFSRLSPLQPAAVAKCLVDEQASVLVSGPPQLVAIGNTSELELPPVHAIFSSGGPIDEAAASSLGARWQPVTEVLGSTETGGIGYRSNPTSAWTPLPGVTVVQGEGTRLILTRGFFPRDQVGPYPCEDRGQVRPDGSFEFLGRGDGVVKVGGRRAHPGHVAALLREVDGVDDAVVVAQPARAGRGAELWALVRSKTLDAGRVRAELARHLDPVVIPKRIRVQPGPLPRNEMGKTTTAAVVAAMEERPGTFALDGL